MYKLKLDYLRNAYPKQHCLAAVLTTNVNNIMAGTPVITSIPVINESTINGNQKKLRLKEHRRPRGAGPARVRRNGYELHIDEAPIDIPREAMREEPIRNIRGDIPGIHPAEPVLVVEEAPQVERAMREEPAWGAIAIDPGEAVPDRERGRRAPNAPRLANLNGVGIKSKLSKILLHHDKITALDLYKMDIDTVNEILRSFNFTTMATVIFNPHVRNNGYSKLGPMSTSDLYFDGRHPLIFDKFSNVELKRLSDIHNKNEMRNFPDLINERLQENRFLNYVFTGVARSNTKALARDLKDIFGSLQHKYPTNLCLNADAIAEGGLRHLVDVVSVSFYKLEDVIPIFDFKRSSGVAIEILLTSSYCEYDDITTGGVNYTSRFLFSENRENVLTIDGEAIARPFTRPTSGAIRDICTLIHTESPNDVASNKISKSKKVNKPKHKIAGNI